MSTLASPGVLVSVQNDTFYAESSAGTVPLVIFATAQDKLIPGSSSTIAEGTLKSKAGKLYTLSSQKDVLQTFGSPIFQTKEGNVIQGDELNEYGLHALFSVMGVTNSALALRADIDLNSLAPSEIEPMNSPLNQTAWFDLKNTNFGIFEHNGGTSQNQILNWTHKTALVPEIADMAAQTGIPVETFGATGDYAVVAYYSTAGALSTEISVGSPVPNAVNRIYHKTKTSGNKWVEVQDITYASMNAPLGKTKGAVWVKYDSAADGMNVAMKKWDASNYKWSNATVQAEWDFIDIEAKLGASLSPGAVGFRGLNKYFYLRTAVVPTTITIADISTLLTKKVWFHYTTSAISSVQKISHTIATAVGFVDFINTKTPLHASVTGNQVLIRSLNGRTFNIFENGFELDQGLFSAYATTNWVTLNYFAQTNAPSRPAAEGTYWYDNSLYADVLVNDGYRWRALQSETAKTMYGSNSKCSIQF